MTAMERLTFVLRQSAIPTPCGEDPELWFSEDKADRVLAASRCDVCPVLALCHEAGRWEDSGIWGGEDRSIPDPPWTQYGPMEDEDTAGVIGEPEEDFGPLPAEQD
jgi:hypothetical protein